MAEDANAQIRVDIDTTAALASIKSLQRQISAFHSQMLASGNAANAAMSQNMQKTLINSINSTGKFAASLTNIKSSAENFTTSLEKNKLGLREYFRYAGASTQSFGKLFKSEFATIEKVAIERVKTLQTQYIKMGRDANGALQAIKVRPLTLDMKNLATQTAVAAQKQMLLNQLIRQGTTNLVNWGKNVQWAGRQLMVGFTLPLALLGTKASQSFIELEKQAVRFKRVYGEMFTSSGETEKALQEVRELADEFTKYGVAVEKTLGLAADLAQQGLQGVELMAQVTQATRLAVLGEVEQQEALQATISITNAFGIAAEDLASKINFLNAVENQTITAIEDLTIAIPKAGPVVRQLGGDVEDLAFFLTAMKEGGINASEGANALKSGLASLINPSEKASQFLGDLGINIKGIVDANAGDVQGIVVEFAKALDDLDPLDRARAIEQLFGKFQFSRLSTLFQNVIDEGSQANRVLQLGQQTAEELAVLADRELKKVEDSPAFKFQKAIEDITVALAPLGEQFLKLITPIVEFVTGMLKKFNEMSDGSKAFVTGVIAVLGLIAPVVLMTVGLVANGVGNLVKAFNALRLFYNKLGGDSTGLASSTQYLTQEQLEAAAVAASLGQSHAQLAQIFTSETQAVQGLIAAYQQAVIAANALSAVAPVARARPELTITTNSRGGRRVQAPQGYADGVLSVPGPKGAGDVVPAMLSPGEAVIPAEQTKKYGALIAGIVADNIPGYERSNVRINIRDDAELTAEQIAARNKQLQYVKPGTEITPAQKEAGYQVRPAGFKGSRLPATSKSMMNSSLGSDDAYETLSTRLTKMGLGDLDQAKMLSTAADIAQKKVGGGVDGVNAYIETVTQTFEELQQKTDEGEVDLLKSDGTVAVSKDFRESTKRKIRHRSKSDASGSPHLAHANEGIQLTGEEISRMGGSGALKLKADLLPALAQNPGGMFGLKTAFGMANFDGILNRKLDKQGISKEEMANELDRTDGIQRWATSVEAVDGDVAELSDEMLIFDNSLKSLVRSLPEGSKIFDSQAKVNEARARGENAYSVTELTSQALINTGDRTSNLRPVLQKAAATVTDISGQGVDRKKATLVPQDYGNPIPQMAEKARQDFAKGIPTEELQRLGAVADVTSQNISDQSTSNSNLATSSGIAEQSLNKLGNAATTMGQKAGAAAISVSSNSRGGRRVQTENNWAKGVLSVPGPKGAGDVVPAMLSPGEAVIPAKMAARYAPFIQDMIAGNVPGFMSGVFLGMPKSSKSVSKGRQAGDEIYERFKQSSYANTPPTEYGHQISPTSGHSFPIFNLGGVYQKGPKQVFVKPMMDETAALAEMRATTIARQAHGLKAPEQRVVVIRDPMDVKRERRFLALESDLDPTFVNTQPMGVFNEEQYFRQLAASLLRADKDLSPSNVYGDVVADVGPAGVFDRASGFREYSSSLPSMEDQALINLLGIKGGAKRAFAESTLGLMAGMTPEQYHQRMIAEIQKVLPRLKETIASFKLTNPTDVGMYDDMIRRLEAGLAVDWRKFHTLHSKVEIAKPKVPKVKKPAEYAKGVVSVPGPKGAGDVVPAMLSPGEAVIPTAMVRKYGPLINSMISDNVPGYFTGKFGDVPETTRSISVPGVPSSGFSSSNMNPPSAPYSDLPKVEPDVPKWKSVLNELKEVTVSTIDSAKKAAIETGSAIIDKTVVATKSIAGEVVAKTLKGSGMGDYTELADGRVLDHQDNERSYNSQAEYLEAVQARELAKKQELNQRVTDRMQVQSNLSQTNPEYSARIKEIAELDKKNADAYRKLTETDKKRYAELKDHVNEMENLALAEAKVGARKNPVQGKNLQEDDKKINIFEGFKKARDEKQTKTETRDGDILEARDKATKQLLELTDEEYKARLAEQKGFNERVALGATITEAEQQENFERQNILREKERLLKEELANAKSQKDLVQQKLQTANQEGIATDKQVAAAQGQVTTDLTTMTSDERKKDTQGKFAKFGGKVAQVGMVASMAVSAASMVPGPVGETAQQLAGPVMAMTTLASFIQGPVSGILVAVVAVLGSMYLAVTKVNEAYHNAQKEAIRLQQSIGGSTESIRKLGEFAGAVTAGEKAEKRRENKFRLMEVAPGKATFGESYMQDEAGQELLKDLKAEVANSGGDTASALKAVSSQLSMSVVSGALTADQAGSIASEIGLELNDASFGVKVRGEITELIGPGGEDLKNNELVIATRLAATSIDNMEQSKEAMNSNLQSLRDISNPTMAGMGLGLDTEAGQGVATGASVLAFAGAGAAIGSIIPGLGTAVGLVAGTLVGAVAGYFTATSLLEEAAKKVGTASGAFVADLTTAVQQQNEIKAVLDETYAKKLDEAAAEGDIAEYKRLQLEYDEKRLGLTETAAELNQNIVDTVNEMDEAGNVAGVQAVMTGLKNAADVKYKDDVNAQTYIPLIDNQIEQADLSVGQEAMLRTQILSDLPLDALSRLLTVGDVEKVVNIVGNLGGPMATEAMMVANMIKDDDLSAKFLLDVEALGTDSVEAQKLIDLATNVQALGGSGVMENSINTVFTAIMDDSTNSDAINDVMFDLDAREVETVEQVYEVVPEFESDPDMMDAFNEEYFATLQSNAQKETYVLASRMIMQIPEATLEASEDFKAWLGDEGARHGPYKGGHSFAWWQQRYADDMAQKVTSSGVVLSGQGAAEPEEETGGGGGPAASPLDDMLKRLRDVRKSQIGVTKGFDASSAAIDKLFGGDRGINLFDGLEQSMRKFGAGEDLISAIAGMDPEEFDKKKNLLFNFDKQTGAIIGFKDKLMNIGEALSAIALGEYVNNQQKSAKESKNQVAAFDLLRSAGYSVADAYEAVQDASFAAALASGNVTRAQLDTMRAEMAAAQEAAKQAARLTPEGMEEVFTEGFNKAMEAFDAKEKQLTLEFDLKMKDDRSAITAAENEIAKIRYEVDDYEASLRGVEDQEKAINKTYDEKLEALEAVRKANQKVLDQEKGKLSVAEAISRGDLAATARAAQDLRATSASGYFSSQTDALNSGRQSALDQVRGEDGLSRIEIEEKIKDLTDQIFEIEEKTLEPAQERIRLAQIDLQARIDELTELGKTRVEWETIKNNIDVARVNSVGYKEAMEEALFVVEDVKNAWAGIQSKEVTLTTIQRTITEGQASPGSTSPGSGGKDPLDPSVDTPAAQSKRVTDAQSGTGGAAVSQRLRAAANALPPISADAAERRIRTYLSTITKAQADQILGTSAGGGGGGGGARGGPSVIRAAAGGPVSGPGTATSDSIPAMLSNGEYVIKAASAKKLGRRVLDSLNSGKVFAGGTPGFNASEGASRLPMNKPAFNKPSLSMPTMSVSRPSMPQIPSGPRFSMPFDPGISKGPVRLPDKQPQANNNSSVYNYNLSVNVASQSDPSTIAQTVMAQLQRVESQRVRNGRF
jgi:TP901 family phage tail tape measure protein